MAPGILHRLFGDRVDLLITDRRELPRRTNRRKLSPSWLVFVVECLVAQVPNSVPAFDEEQIRLIQRLLHLPPCVLLSRDGLGSKVKPHHQSWNPCRSVSCSSRATRSRSARRSERRECTCSMAYRILARNENQASHATDKGRSERNHQVW